jgi:hypothetical protein
MSYLKKIEDLNRTSTRFPGGIAEGANVRTPCGARRVELVCAGDLIVTRDNGLQPVRMVWQREVTSADMAANIDLAPICIKPRAIGPMMPQREMRLAPEHRILVPGYRLLCEEKTVGCLLKARELAGTSDAVYVDFTAEIVRYFTLVFDAHQVFCCNGLPVESFYPSAETILDLDDGLRDDLLCLFPKLKRKRTAYPALKYKVAVGAEYLVEYF